MDVLYKRKNSGITLIALVITIIVLLLLAGIIISVLTGDNGLLTKVATAKQENEVKTELELIKLAVTAAQTAGEGILTEENLNNELRANFNDNNETAEKIGSNWYYKRYCIDEKGNVEKYDKLLPKEYQQVEYIESTGTQWIDTGIKGNSVHKLYCGLDIVSMINGNWANIMSANLDYLSLGTDQMISRVYTRVNWNYNHPVVIQNGNCNDFMIDKNNVVCNGSIVQSYDVTKLNGNHNGNIYLFNNNAKSRGSASRIYYFKTIDDTTFNESINLIPCYSTTTVFDVHRNECTIGTIGMYDLVSNEFFTNQGTGEFLKGNDV